MKKVVFLLAVVMLLSCITLTAWADNTVTLSGTVSLPEGVVADSDIFIGVFAQSVGESFAIRGYNAGYDTYAEILAGTQSAEYSVQLPAGNYIIEVYAEGRADGTLLGNLYYNNEKLSTRYGLAQPMSISEDTDIDMTLPATDRYISGTLTFDKPVAEDTYVEFYAYTEYNTISYDSYGSIVTYPVVKGTKTLDYCVPVEKGSTTLGLKYNNESYDLKANNVFTSAWDYNRYFDTATASYDNIDAVMVSYEENVEDTIEITVDLGEPAAEWNYYMLTAYSAEDNFWVGDATAEIFEGEQTKTIYLNNPGVDFYLMLISEMGDGEFFVGGEYGLTSKVEEATVFSCEETRITVNFPEYIDVKGTIARNGVLSDNSFSVYVQLDANDGSVYTGTAYFDASASDGEFIIKLPQWLDGTSGSVYCYGNGWTGETADVQVGNTDNVNLALPDYITNKYDVEIKLSEAAPAGGVGVTVYYGGLGNYVYIPEGGTGLTTTFEFFVSGYYDSPYLTVASEDLGFIKEHSIELTEGETNVINIEKTTMVVVSGTVTLPKYLVGNGVTLEVYVGLSGDSVYTDITIPKGETSGKYSVYAPQYSDLTVIYCRDYNTETNYYYKHNGDEYFKAISLENDFVADIDAEDFAKLMVEDTVAGNIDFSWGFSSLFEDGSGLCTQFYCNNKTANTYKPIMFLAVYDENGKLVETQVNKNAKFYANDNRGHTAYFYTTVNPDYTYKTMLVNNTYYLTPLLDAIIAQ